MKDRKLFKKGDIIIIAAVAALALVLLAPSLVKKDSLTAQIYVDGQMAEEIDLSAVSESYSFSPKDGTKIEVENGKIRFASAVCRDKLCVKSGWLDRNGQTAACLPERIVISIKGGGSAPDMLTY